MEHLFLNLIKMVSGPVVWGCRTHRVYSCNECPGYNIKQSDGEASVVLELWGIQSAFSLPSLPGPLWPGMVVPDRILAMGQKIIWYLIGLVSFFNGIWTFVGYLMPKTFSKKNRSGTIYPIAGRIREFITFPKVFDRKWT